MLICCHLYFLFFIDDAFAIFFTIISPALYAISPRELLEFRFILPPLSRAAADDAADKD